MESLYNPRRLGASLLTSLSVPSQKKPRDISELGEAFVRASELQRWCRFSTGQAMLGSPGSSRPSCFVHRMTSEPPLQSEYAEHPLASGPVVVSDPVRRVVTRPG